jgi:hypothetical protein
MRRCRPHGSIWSTIAIAGFVLLGALPPSASGAPRDDAYVAGYVAAILERQLNVSARSLRVRDGVVTVDAADVPRSDQPKLVAALSAVPGVTRVEIAGAAAPIQASPAGPAAAAAPPGAAAPESPAVGFLPGGHLFRALIADPRWPHFSGAYRYYLTTSGPTNVFAGTFGETIPFYRGALGGAGRWEVGLQAGVFSIFELDSATFDLINSDFFVAATLGYRLADFSAMGRYFHQSSHLGDELLLRDTRPNRENLSYEGLDVKLSYDLPLGLRAYGGGGYLVRVDPSDLGRGFAQAGGEWRSPWALWGGRLRPVAGLDLQFREENDWHTDLSLRAGLQFESVAVLSRNLQLLVEYFNGRSFDGQFYRDAVEFVGLGLHFHF